jgi:hypothetical protein
MRSETELKAIVEVPTGDHSSSYRLEGDKELHIKHLDSLNSSSLYTFVQTELTGSLRDRISCSKTYIDERVRIVLCLAWSSHVTSMWEAHKRKIETLF